MSVGPPGVSAAAATPTVPSWTENGEGHRARAVDDRGKPDPGAIKRRLAEAAITQVEDHLHLAGGLIRQQEVEEAVVVEVGNGDVRDAGADRESDRLREASADRCSCRSSACHRPHF